MSLLTVNGFPIIKGSIRLPRVGVWSADVHVDTQTAVSGPVTVTTDDGSFSLKGVAYRSGIFQSTLSMRIIGGAGGLSPAPGGVDAPLPPKHYQGCVLKLVLSDILTACGETLSTTADTTILNLFLKNWVRLAGPGKLAVSRLLDSIATSWRILGDGTFWVGTDTYPAAPNTQFDVLERNFGEGRILIGTARPFLFPGTTLTITISGTQSIQNVSNVVHEIYQDRIRTEVWFERSGVQS